jgi:hypothetical protein
MDKKSDKTGTGRLAIAIWAMAAIVLVYLGYMFILGRPPEDSTSQTFAEMPSTRVYEMPGGHAYQYIAAPNLTWDMAQAEARSKTFKGQTGYLATITSMAEHRFILDTVFGGERNNVTYLGGRQTARGVWRWVSGPEAGADNGKGLIFWNGDEKGQAPDTLYADWMFTAFQHGGKWDVDQVCCVTLFSYRLPQFSTSLGNGDPEEGVVGYLVEFGQ